MAFAPQTQSDWGGGMFRQRKAPPDGCYDAVNMLLGDDGLLFKRGGSAYYSASDATNNLTGLAQVQTVAGFRTLMWDSAKLYVLDGSNNPASLPFTTGTLPGAASRVARMGSFTMWACAAGGANGVTPAFALYGGSLKTAGYSTGTVTVANGSPVVTGAGTAWLANVDKGMLFLRGGTEYWPGVVATVDSNTQITLTDAYGGPSFAGVAYSLVATHTSDFGGFGFGAIPPPGSSGYLLSGGAASAVTSAGQRAIVCQGGKAFVSERNQPFNFLPDGSSYLDLGISASITGAFGQGDNVFLFTNGGIFTVSNLALSAVDDFGNIQWTQQQISDEIALWGNPGIAGWHNQHIVPALDDVYLFSGGSSESITMWSIRALYRSYVKAGYSPGTATTFRGHYFLPILNGTTVVDVLVARLDRPHLLSSRPRIWMYPWTRWSGHATGGAYASRPSSGSGPTLLSINAKRVTDLTSTFDPTTTNAVEADATAHSATIESNDLPTSGEQPGFVKKARATYVLTDDGNGATAAPTVALAVSSDEDAGAYTTLTDSGLQRGGTAGVVSDGTRYSWWTVSKRRQRVRFRITQTGACASFVLRSFSFFSRGSGKQ